MLSAFRRHCEGLFWPTARTKRVLLCDPRRSCVLSQWCRLSADASQQGFTKLVPLPPRCPRGHRRSRWNCPRAELPAGTRGISVRALCVARLRSGHPGRCRLSRGRAGTHRSRRGWLPPPAGCGSRACRAGCRRRAPVARSARGSPRTPKRSATGPTVEVAAMTAPTVHRTQRRPAANEVGLVSHDLRMDRRERRASPVSALGLTGPISSNLDVPYAVEPSEVPNSLQLECCSQSRNCSAGIGSPMK